MNVLDKIKRRFKKEPKITIFFDDEAWRMEFRKINGFSNIKCFANNECIFEGCYGKLVNIINKQQFIEM